MSSPPIDLRQRLSLANSFRFGNQPSRLGVGFVFTSVWFWQTAAFSFAPEFTQRFDLDGIKRR